MRRATYLLMPLVAVALGTAAFGGISGTAHDFSGEAVWNPSGEICLPCHTPHGAVVDGAGDSMVLWNHAVTAESFTMYSAYAVDRGDRDADADVLPGSPSKLCLSCHDGVTAVDAFGPTPGSTYVISGAAAIGVDLRGDHPIGIQYPADGTSGYNLKGDLPPVKLANWGGKTDRVECSTCHEPHSDSFAKFLRMDNGGSLLCLQCHAK